ncbi:MFS multidrug transporter like protein [Zymoseptoria brevis]|uniref:MFS multidrug transporter like protein n=1 Tax=Zymoseptoria brevis TaxID=1047168 RepID=A0A0F4GDX7_9PEZI|nr:MFS multidrug transporter like protein [Zymoseptoria brevis]
MSRLTMERSISVTCSDVTNEKDEDEHNEYKHGIPHTHIDIAPDPLGHTAQHGAYEHHQHHDTNRDAFEEKHFVDWEGPDDPENPFNWSDKRKWLITITTCFISVLLGLPAGAYGVATPQMKALWSIDETNFPYISFGLVTWNMGAAIAPLVFVPLTENTGRMPGYFASYVLFLLFLLPSALAPNFATILVTRFFAGGASSVAINIVGGTITDIWRGDRARSLPMSIFALSGVVGIALGPFIGGAITTSLSWRWIYWIQLIIDGGLLPIFYFILTETRGDVLLMKRAQKLRKEGYKNVTSPLEQDDTGLLAAIRISFLRPTKMLTSEFVVIAFTLWVSFAWGILFLFQSSVPLVFSQVYAFSTFQVTLVQLAVSVGALLATLLNPLQDALYLSSAHRNTERPGKPIPEARLYTAVPGSLIFSAGMFWFGWTSREDIHWIVPTFGLGCVGVGVYSIYLSVVNYLADAYEKYAGSALSAASMGRNVFGAFLPLATPALYGTLGTAWASSLVGLIGLALSAVPVVLLVKGQEIRAKSPFMLESTYDAGEAEARRESLARRRG